MFNSEVLSVLLQLMSDILSDRNPHLIHVNTIQVKVQNIPPLLWHIVWDLLKILGNKHCGSCISFCLSVCPGFKSSVILSCFLISFIKMPIYLKLEDKNFLSHFFNKVTNHLIIPHCTAYVLDKASFRGPVIS